MWITGEQTHQEQPELRTESPQTAYFPLLSTSVPQSRVGSSTVLVQPNETRLGRNRRNPALLLRASSG